MSTHNIHLKYRTPERYPIIISIVPPSVALLVTFQGSNYRCPKQIFMVPKGFEPLKFDCIYCLFCYVLLWPENLLINLIGSILFCYLFLWSILSRAMNSLNPHVKAPNEICSRQHSKKKIFF